MNNGLMNAGDIANQALQKARTGEYVEHSGVYHGQEFVDRVCAKLRAITKGYNKKMGSSYGEVEFKRQLLLALAENELTTDESIEPALNYYRGKDEWMPTPAQFVAACKIRHAAGCPTAKEAYLEYCLNCGKPNHEWSHEIVVATVRLSKQGYEIRSLPEEKAFIIYERAYQILMDRINKNEPLDVPIPKALPQEATSRTCSPKENLGMLASMRGDLGI